jgi:hypothetical protein
LALKLKVHLIRSGGAVTSDDFGHARDDRAAEAVRVLDRNDSHRFWFEPRPGCGRRLTSQIGNRRAASTPFARPRVYDTYQGVHESGRSILPSSVGPILRGYDAQSPVI